MNQKELKRHQKEKIPFIVRGEPMVYNPKVHGGDPHALYREVIHKADLAVYVETVEYYRAQRKRPEDRAIDAGDLLDAISALAEALVYVGERGDNLRLEEKLESAIDRLKS